MRKAIAGLVTGLFLICGVAAANADSLLINGNFDDDLGLSGTSWGVYASIPGWTKTFGSGIEVQRNTIVTAHSGNQYIELDSNPAPGNSGMFQSVVLSTGWYELDFFYQPRTNNTNDNGIGYGIENYFSWTVDATKQTWNGWQEVSQTFYIETDSVYNVFFSAYGDYGTAGGNTFGGFIDSASLTAAPVPEPATMLLFGAGLLGLAGLRLRKKKN